MGDYERGRELLKQRNKLVKRRRKCVSQFISRPYRVDGNGCSSHEDEIGEGMVFNASRGCIFFDADTGHGICCLCM